MKIIMKFGIGLLAYAAFGLGMIQLQGLLFPVIADWYRQNPNLGLTLPLFCGLVVLAVRGGFGLCQKLLFALSR